MTQLRSFAMTDNRDTFRSGACAYRNARDWAKERRDEFIKSANERHMQKINLLIEDAILKDKTKSNYAINTRNLY
ncbi:hypothetical protein ACJ73_09211 [Blastomyces percursus]|uniref:Uncharacterized protein n=1 Tax=Blastomyces percursus TaxID=1658174 RepID=A0A1J9QBS9_9EURO|nr:hypothetical protein ACJ73_09211 [Blastomyces percursus]